MKITLQRIILGLLAVIAFLLTWWILSGPAARTSLNSREDALASQDKVDSPPSSNQSASSQKPPPKTTFTEQLQGFFEAFNTSIDFYGRVVDQHGNPVPGAEVKLAANDKASGGSPSKYVRETDVNGNFSIAGVKGITLAVEVSKDGYRVIPPVYGKVTSSGLFEYGLSSQGSFQSSKEKPAVFTLDKRGEAEPLIKIGEKSFRVARDGTPLRISVNEGKGHNVVLRCWNTETQRPKDQQKYDWKMEIAVENGGLQPREDALAFEAPEDGYMPSETINMPMSLGQDWDSFVGRAYFIRFGDGTFARASLRMRAGGDHFVVWESYYNPKSGSRNLEYDPSKVVRNP